LKKLRHLLFLVLLCAGPSAASDTDGLNILVYGATGEIGSLVVVEALDRGHQVTAVSRDPSSIERRHQNLVVAKGDLLDAASIESLSHGQDVVISSVRGVIGDKADPANALQLISVENIVEALRKLGNDAPRFIHVGGSGSLEVEPGVLYAEKLPKLLLPKGLESEIIGQIWALDYLRNVADVQWTYATPPKKLTNGKRTEKYRIGGDRVLKDDRGRTRVSRADFAAALIDEAENAAHVRQRFSVAY
jgi:putative NADH-flavin reductase